MSVTLEERIMAAHKRGDKGELKLLQAEYRNTRSVYRVTRPPSLTDHRPASASGRSSGRAPADDLPELRYAARLTVELSRYAYESIDLVLGDTADGCETGGCLLGVTTPEGIRVENASGPHPDAERTSRRFSVDWDYWERFERAQARDEGERWRGDWHTHYEAGAARPSETDLRGWVRCRDAIGAVYVGLIVSSSEDFGLAPVRFQAWTVSRSDGRTVCEPATLVLP
jgi:JAB domain-containing protein similar to deubiquitination enzymes